MPLSDSAHASYAVDPHSRLAIVRMSGTLKGSDMRLIVARVHDDPAWQTGFDAIWDCSDVQSHVVLPGEVGPILDEVVEGEMGRDILLEGPGLAADLFSKLLALRIRRRGGNAEVVSSMDEALGALGLDAAPAAFQEMMSV